MMRLYYTFTILIQILTAILFRDKNKLAFMLYLLEDISEGTHSTTSVFHQDALVPKKQIGLETNGFLSSR